MSGINWTERFDEALAQSSAQKRDILLDFTAAPM